MILSPTCACKQWNWLGKIFQGGETCGHKDLQEEFHVSEILRVNTLREIRNAEPLDRIGEVSTIIRRES